MAGKRDEKKWLLIQRDWELDKYPSNRELASAHAVSHTAINNAAKGMPDKEGKPTRPPWQKRLASKVEQRAAEILAMEGIESEEGETTADLVEKAAQQRVDVIRKQRAEIEEMRKDLDLMGKGLRLRLTLVSKAQFPTEEQLAAITRDGERYMRQRRLIHEMENKTWSVKPEDDTGEDVAATITEDELIDAVQELVARGSVADRPGADD